MALDETGHVGKTLGGAEHSKLHTDERKAINRSLPPEFTADASLVGLNYVALIVTGDHQVGLDTRTNGTPFGVLQSSPAQAGDPVEVGLIGEVTVECDNAVQPGWGLYLTPGDGRFRGFAGSGGGGLIALEAAGPGPVQCVMNWSA